MHITKNVEFPKELRKLYRKATKYEWISLFYMISAATFSFLVMSNSQTMKTVWLEDSLGIVPPASFLIASKIRKWKANSNFPYGYHKVTGIAYLTSSLALLLLGSYLFFDGLSVLLKKEHPSIPNFYLFGHSIWMGYLMIVALLWSSIPSTILGHIKIPLAYKLYDKILFADSKMNKASWMSGFASIFGIIGIGLGMWWADASVGIIISMTIISDGFTNLKQSVLDLIDEVPKKVGGKETDPLIAEVKKLVKNELSVNEVHVRFRDEGHVFFGEIFIAMDEAKVDPQKLLLLKNKIEKFHWRLHDITIMPFN